MKILGYEYRVVVDGTSDEIDAYGRLHVDMLLIQIAEDLHKCKKESAVLHEIIEALNYHLGLDLPHSAIMALEAGLYQTLTDNGIVLSSLVPEAGSIDEDY